MKYHYRGNKKLGKMFVSKSSIKTCPDSCSHKKQGTCYGMSGPLSWKNAWPSVGFSEDQYADFLTEVRKQKTGSMWRHNEVGDLWGDGEDLDRVKFLQLVEANYEAKAKGFGFSQKTSPENWPLFRIAAKKGLTINLSANSMNEADKLYDSGLPVAVTLPLGTKKAVKTPKGRTVVVCPYDTHKVQCIDCGLCARADRKTIVGFPVHGVRKKKWVADIASA